MLNQLELYLKLGFNHILDINGYDHILFLAVLIVPFLFKDYKKIVLLVSIFTIGHTLALLLAVYKIIHVSSNLVELLIPTTILITAIYAIIFTSKAITNFSLEIVITLFFGLIHGLGFSSYFKMIIGNTTSKILPLLEFALGLEIAQILIVLVLLIVNFLARSVFGISKKTWIIIISSIVIGLVIPMF